ncbi:hypothetical protein P7K49_022343 [Saguinus oedipus]|uniref:Uncharacterized protein n=1 Tax=Saguinus oedipus TaxID=9490 RepID=A0ABQ9UW55_SAGOE|nr:hypothetical protein P7K49_022343 [Saguinus oedipus]
MHAKERRTVLLRLTPFQSSGKFSDLKCPVFTNHLVGGHQNLRRLRHLRNIAARNIVNRNGHQLLDTYFTLHLCSTEKIYKEFYRSEVIKNSLKMQKCKIN